MRSFLSIVAAPTLCLGVLGGVVWENGRHSRPQDAEPFHAAARDALEHWTPAFGAWTSPANESDKIPTAAQDLLKPNALVYRRYTRIAGHRGVDQFDLLVVQCKTASDMSGHYPPNCYKNSGQDPVGQPVRRTWDVPGLDRPIRGVEYRFASKTFNAPAQVVYNFFVLPGRGICPDMDDVREAVGDYQRKHFGATQVQVLFTAPADTEARDEAFVQLLAANAAVIRKLDRPGL